MSSLPEVGSLFSEGIFYCCRYVADVREDLFAGEAGDIQNAIPRRQAEFAAGRGCARRALARLGVAPCPIPRGTRGQPLWPDGIVGAISHCHDICVAAVAPRALLAGIGVDVERCGDMTPGVARQVLTATEWKWAVTGGTDPRPRQSLLFSAKESLFKCLFPVLERWLDFDAAVAGPGAGDGDLSLVLAPAIGELLPAGRDVSGRFLFWEGYVFTSVLLRPAAAPPGQGSGQ